MTKADKTVLLEELTDKFQDTKFFYLTDFSGMNAGETNDFRRKCSESQIEMRVIKNTLIKTSLKRISEDGYDELLSSLKGQTAVLFSEEGKAPAVVIKEFREGNERPILKAAYIDQDVIVGDDQLEFLTKLKSKNDLLGELITLLQSPATNLASALQGPEQELVGALNYAGNTLTGLLKAIEERNAE